MGRSKEVHVYTGILAIVKLTKHIEGSIKMLVYYTKTTILYAGLFNSGLIVCCVGLFCSRKVTRKIGRFCLGLLANVLGLKYEMKGAKNIEKNRSYVIISNHQHAIDLMAMMQVYDHLNNLVVVAKHGLKWLGPFGLALQFIGTVFVRKGHLKESLPILNNLTQTAKAEGTSVYLFPEGSRHLAQEDKNAMLPFKKGAFHVAIAGGYPILPVVISEYNFIDPKNKKFESAKVTLETLEPIETTGLRKEDINELIEKVRSNMIATFEKTRQVKESRNESFKKHQKFVHHLII